MAEIWKKMGTARATVRELIDVGRVLVGSRPHYHSWVKIKKDGCDTFFQLGPLVNDKPAPWPSL